MALSKDKVTHSKGVATQRLGRRKVAANAVIFHGAAVAKNAAGYLVPLSDAAGLSIVGISEEHVDNTGGGNGALDCAYATGLQVEFKNDGSIGLPELGRACYAINDETVGDAGAAVNDVFVGVVQDFDAATVMVLVDEAHSVIEALEGPFDGGDAANVANAQTAPGIPVVYTIAIPDAATGDTDVVIDDKIEVLDFSVQQRGGAGNAGNSYTLKNGANAISDAIGAAAADKAVSRAGTIDDAFSTIAAAGTLRISHVKGGGSSAALATIIGVKRA